MEIDFFDDLFSGSNKLDEHSVAWLSKDWTKVQKLSDSFKETTERVLFKTLDNLTVSKKPAVVDVDGDYSKYMIDNALSNYVDCLTFVNEMNLFGAGLTDQMHHDYYLHAIPKEKRYAKWASYKEDIKDLLVIRIIMKRSNVDNDTAKMYMSIMEGKGTLIEFLKKSKFLLTDEFYKTITKNNKDKKILMEIVESWK